MTPERWTQICEILQAAVERRPEQRASFLEEACAGDATLRTEVESLIAYQERASTFLEKPAYQEAAPLILDAGPSLEGRSLGHYLIERKIGAGGMGEVYLARDTSLGRRVAIKVLAAEIMGDESAQNRLIREARAAATLDHPNICAIYEVGTDSGQSFIVMQYVEGQTLAVRMEEFRLELHQALDIVTKVADALAEAHSRGIIHRDIKPDNIMITPRSEVKLMDFGLAKMVKDLSGLQSDAGMETSLTAPGLILGTVPYMSPEQVRAEEMDGRSDIFSLGVVLYKMLTGRQPFAGPSVAEVLSAILTKEPLPIAQYSPGVPAEAQRIVSKALRKDRNDRYQTARDLLIDLKVLKQRLASADAVPQTFSSASQVVSVQPAADLEVPALAVLDFENASRDSSLDWYGTGIAETITADLKKIRRFRVIGRERIYAVLKSASKLDNQDTDFSAIGRQLGVKWLVGGSYQKAGDLIRIATSLLEVEGGKVIATNKMDGKWEDVFVLQDRVVTDLLSFMEVNVRVPRLPKVGSAQDKQLRAYQHYAQGRKALYDFDKESLVEARQHLEIAIELDSDYAVAYSSLGYTHAMRFIHTGDPSEFARALSYLERAISLDAELGEPYPYLCYIYARTGRMQEAIEAGLKGVDLQPDLVQAHYYLGGALTFSTETAFDNYQRAVDSLLNAVRIEPRWESSWVVLGWLALMAGDYEKAEHFLVQKLDLSNTGTSFGKFMGAEMLLGSVWLRRLDWEKSKQFYNLALESLSKSDQMYREVFMALSACGLGDLHLRLRLTEPALANFHQAWRIAKEFPMMMGNARVLTRTLAGMAAAYAINGDKGRAEQLASDAKERLEPLLSEPQSFVLDASVAQIAYALAVTRLHLGDPAGALDLLERAVDKGWRDPKWLQSDPELEPVRKEARFHALLGRINALPSLKFS